jgi:hypothetical protein
VGDERNIRYFGYQLYTEGYSFSEWPIDKINSVELEFFISSLIRKMQIKLPYTSVQRLKTVLAVNTIRLANGHCVRGLRLNNRMLKDIEEVFSSVGMPKRLFPFDLDEEAMVQIFFPYSTFVYLKNAIHLEEILLENKQLQSAHNYLSKWLIHVSMEHQVPLTNLDQLTVDIHNVSQYYQKGIQTRALLFDPRKNFIYSIRENYPNLYRQLFNGLMIYRKKMDQFANETIIDYLIHLLFTRWHNLLPKLQEKAEHNVNLLVFSVSDIHHARMIKDYLHYHFQSRVTIDLRSIYQMDHEELSSLSYDIMISNGPLPELPSSLCLCIETLPTPQDVQVIKQKIKEIRLKKLECEV